ncbi:type IV secretory system conjugative DNA transfer family protein [Thermoanaerobacter mathranii]|uniref:type IV secretory system conjugative DNA transfer family protein n=1 Tax=Thermoanaerobacter mathranii TaxID=583357 RepID=UPI003D6C6B8D
MEEKDNNLGYLAVFFAVVLIFTLFTFSLKLAGSSGSFSDAASSFIANRIEGKPLNTLEKKGVIYFAIITAGTVAAAGGGWFFFGSYIKNIKRKRLLQRRYASQHGSSEWGSLREVKRILGSDGIVLGSTKRFWKTVPVRLSARYSYEHTAVIGPTGCGKSSTFFMPNLLLLPEGVSAVVTDPKGELQAITSDYLKSRGWEIQVFAPTIPEISYGYDPLRCINSEMEIADIADIILKNGYDPEGRGGDTQWINFSAPLFEAVLYAARYKYGPKATVDKAVHIVTDYPEDERAAVFKRIGGTALNRYLTYLQSIESPETAGSIRTVLTASVRVFGRPDVLKAASKEPLIDFNALREHPTVLFVRIPERKAHILKPLMATFFWQLLEHIADVDGLPIYFFLDEFPNIGKIPGFASMAATLRSRKISLNVGMQGVEQLAREYSEQEQKDILNNLKTKIYYSGVSGETGEYASTLAGYATVKEKDMEQRVELLSAAELRTIPEHMVLVMTRNFQPFFLDALHYSTVVKMYKIKNVKVI